MGEPSAIRRVPGLVVAEQTLMAENADKVMNPGDEAPPGTPGTGEDICPECKGSGKIRGASCANCGGSGKIVRAVGGA